MRGKVIIVTCIVFFVGVLSIVQSIWTNSTRDLADWECIVEYNDKIYSVVTASNSSAYENYNLEEIITASLLGDYLGKQTTQIDNDGNMMTYKIYTYRNAATTSYGWYPRLILENVEGEYFHALIGSVFEPDNQTAAEVFTVYGLSSSDDIVSIENEDGYRITDKDFITQFYHGIFTQEYGGEDFLQENVYENTGLDESEIGELYSTYADHVVSLKVTLKNGLVMGIDFTSHHYIELDHRLFFKVDDETLLLLDIFK